jgi:hypothetical protein
MAWPSLWVIVKRPGQLDKKYVWNGWAKWKVRLQKKGRIQLLKVFEAVWRQNRPLSHCNLKYTGKYVAYIPYLMYLVATEYHITFLCCLLFISGIYP